MIRSIISEEVVKEKHKCVAEVMRVERVDNFCACETKIYCNAVFSFPLDEGKYINDVEKLLQHIIYNLDDRIIDIYKGK